MKDYVLVTGSAGFIGYALTQELLRQGKHVLGYDLVKSDHQHANYPSVVGDLNDIHRIHSIFKKYSITSIVHCGAISGPMLALDNPHGILQINIMGTANLLEAARVHGVEIFVYCSSGSAYGKTRPGVIDEQTPLFPNDVYGATKACGEHLVQAYSDQHGLDGVSLRICWVYGPRRRTDCVVRQMILDALHKRPTILDWGQNDYRQYIYIDDAVSALVAALDHPRLPKPVYNISGEAGYVSIAQVAEAVRSVLPEANIQLGPGADSNDAPRGAFDISAAKQDLGFAPKYSLVEGIRVYTNWLRVQASAS